MLSQNHIKSKFPLVIYSIVTELEHSQNGVEFVMGYIDK